MSYHNPAATAAARAPHPFVREVAFVNELAGLSDAEIAQATGAAPATARAWLAQTRSPTAERADHEERRRDHGDDEPERDRARLDEQVLISELLPDRGGQLL